MLPSVNSIIEAGGIAVIALIIFAESGLLVGFFLPGDTLLFAAGFFAAQGKLSLGWLILIVTLAAIVGFETGYYIGKRTGPRLFKKEEGILFRREYIARAEAFYNRHGSKTIFFSRFIPVIRTLAPLMAGVGSMNRRKFTLYNIFGGVLWITLVILLGDWLGRQVPNIDSYLMPIIVAAMIFTFSPTLIHIFRDPRARRSLYNQLTRRKYTKK